METKNILEVFMGTQKERWAAIVEEINRQAPENEWGSATRLAKRLGVTRGTISKYKSGNLKGIRVSVDDTEKFEKILGIYSKTPAIQQNKPAPLIKPANGQNIVTIPVYASAGAGPAIEMSGLEPLFSVTAPAQYLYQCDFAVMVDGHSMEPTLQHQSVVGVRENCDLKANELYVAYIPYEGMVVKRIGVDMESGQFIFKSDNPDKQAYPDYREYVEAAQKIILGRVVWVLRGY